MRQFTQFQKYRDPFRRGFRWNDASERAIKRNARAEAAQRPQPTSIGGLFLELTQQFATQRGAGRARQMLEAGEQPPAIMLQLGVQTRARLLAANAEVGKVVSDFMLMSGTETTGDAPPQHQPIDLGLKLAGKSQSCRVNSPCLGDAAGILGIAKARPQTVAK